MTIVAKSPADTGRVLSQIEKLQRSEISNPPAYGSRIVDIVLNDPALYAEWKENLRYMSNRIIDMRKQLYDRLVQLGTPGTWNHITDQIGMFSFTGLKGIIYIYIYIWARQRINDGCDRIEWDR